MAKSTSLLYLAVVLATANLAHAWFRLPCTLPLVQQRLDPIVSPGQTPSQHVHTVHGGSNFAANSTYDTLRASKCTSCQVTQDLSNYCKLVSFISRMSFLMICIGFPKLYFRDPKTKQFEEVPNGGTRLIPSCYSPVHAERYLGLLAYYQNRGSLDKINGGPGLKAFPPGFRMITGDAKKRSQKYQSGLGTQQELAERAIQWICLRYTTSNQDYNGVGGFPHTNCEAGFQSRLHFPACWDGKNVDSTDHKSHVAFLSILDNGSCPPTHPVGLMKLFYEVTWDIDSFAGRWQESDGWPFVYATGDSTGWSWHGDFQNGWDVNALQKAIDECNDPSNDTINGVADACKHFKMIPAATANQCRTPKTTSEETGGKVLAKLPGCNPIQTGPGDATLYTDANCPK